MAIRFILQLPFLLLAATAALGNSVSVTGSLTQQSGSSSCTYSSISESTPGNWAVTCGTGGKSITFTPGICGTVCTSFTSIRETTAGLWTVSGCVSAINSNTTLTQPASPVPNLLLGSPLLLSATATVCSGTLAKIEFLAKGPADGDFSLIPGASITSSPYQFNWTPTATGSYNVEARATDSLGGVGPASTPVNVYVNRAPATPSLTVSAPNGAAPPGPWASLASFTVSASASDPDAGDTLRIEIWNGTSQLGSINSASGQLAWSNVAAGTYSVFARAYDNHGASTDSAAIPITVTAANQLPTAQVTAPTAGSSVTRPLTLTAAASDPDGTVVQVDFIDESNGQSLGHANASPFSIQWQRPAAGVHSIHALATDNSGGQSASASVSFTVANAAPAVQISAPTSSATLTAPVTLSAIATDSDGAAPPTVQFVEDSSGATIGTGTAAGTTYSFSWTAPSVGVHTVHARATDDDGQTTNSAPITFTVAASYHLVLSAEGVEDANGNRFVAPATIKLSANTFGLAPFTQMTLFVDGVSAGTFTAPQQGFEDWAITTTVVTDGAHRFSAVATASDGSVGTTNTTTLFIDYAPPPAALAVCTAEDLTSPAPGATPGSAGVSDMGAATYSVPIQIPPAIAGVAPQLALAYSSQGGNGLLGVGGSLQGLSVIHRCAQTLYTDSAKTSVTNTSTDALCMDGQRLIVVAHGADVRNGLTEYRTEHEAYSRITSSNPLNPLTQWSGPAYFKVETKSGQILWYGLKVTEASPDQAPQDAVIRTYPIGSAGLETARVWALYRIEDRFGNYVLIRYDTSNQAGTQRPLSISYTGNSQVGAHPTSRIEFAYDPARPDPVHSYGGGQASHESNRLVAVKTFSDVVEDSSGNRISGTAVKTYNITYGAASTTTARSVARSVTECAGDGGPPCLRPTTFSWTDEAAPSQPTFAYGTPWTGAAAPDKRDGAVAADLNGDGRTDLISPRDSVSGWNVCLSNGSSFTTRLGQAGCEMWSSGTRVTGNGADDIWNVADFDGDGRADIIYLTSFSGADQDSTTGVFTLELSRSNTASGNHFEAQSPASVQWKGANIGSNGPYARAIGDFDGDGRADLALYNGTTSDVASWQFCSWKGSLVCTSTPVSLVGAPQPPNSPNAQWDYIVADFDGDGRADFAFRENNSIQWRVCLSTSTLLQFSFNCSMGLVNGIDANAYETHIADVNGDGMADLLAPANPNLTHTTGDWQVCMSKGDMTFDCQTWNIGVDIRQDDAFLGDFNGDGRTDVAWYSTSGWNVCESTGSAFRCRGPYGGGAGGGATPNHLDNVRAGDFNGDGKTDVAAWYSGSAQWAIGLSTGPATDLVRTVTNGLQAQAVFAYKPLTDASVYAPVTTPPAYPEISIQSPMYVVSEMDSSTMVATGSPFYTLTYTYSGLRGHAQGGGLAGFADRTVMDPQTHICSETQSPSDSTMWAERRAGLPKTLLKKYGATALVGGCSGGNLLDQIFNTYAARRSNTWGGSTDAWSAPAGSLQIWETLLTASHEDKNDFDGSPLPSVDTVTDIASFDAYGSAKSISITTSTQSTGSDAYATATVSTFLNSPSNWIMGRPTSTTVTKSTPNSVSHVNNYPARSSTFTYDNGSPPTKGAVTKTVVEPSGDASTYLSTTYEYDSFGNRTTVTTSDSGGTGLPSRVSKTIYCAVGTTAGPGCTPDGRFPRYLENAMGHTERRDYDTRFGLVNKDTDANSLDTLSQYDRLGRKYCETRADQSQTRWTWSDASSPYAYAVSIYDSSIGPSLFAKQQLFDGLQREAVVNSRAFDGSATSITTNYDALGRVASTTKPYASTYGTTSYQYDPLGRMTSESGPRDYAASYVYHGSVTSVTLASSAGAQTTTKTTNNRGETIDILDARGAHLILQYDYFGGLERKSVVPGADGGSPTATTIYLDVRGRKKQMDDPDQGTWHYMYDAWDDVLTQTNADSTMTFQYDKLGRKLHRSRQDNPGYSADWTFDAVDGIPCGKSVGRLCKTTNISVTREYQYDRLARLATVKDSNDRDRSFVRSVTYDGMSRPVKIVYPVTGLTLAYLYNAYGYLYRITEPAQGITHWWGVNRYADGKIHLQDVGTTETTTTYDELGRPATIYTPPDQNASYTFDALGNLTARLDSLRGVSETFTYDTLNRLSIATTNGTARTYHYDSLGSLVSSSDVGSITYKPGTHQIQNAHGDDYVYDSEGKLQVVGVLGSGNGPNKTISYTPFDEPLQVTHFLAGGSSKAYYYEYDADGQRAVVFRMTEGTSNSLTQYFSDGTTPFFEEERDFPPGTAPSQPVLTWSQYINTPEGVGEIIRVVNDGTSTSTNMALVRDHLGSTVAVRIGGTSEYLGYDAWGERRNPNGTTNPAATSVNTVRGFTGHEMMDDVGLINMNGRIYDPTVGRFTQADPIVQAPNNLQSYNGYSYALNNPLSYIDPSGFSWWTRNGRPVFRAIAAITASWFSYGITSTWISSYIYTSQFTIEMAAGANTFEATMASSAAVSGSSIGIGAASGAAAGFAAGGIQGGNLQSALYGALSGGVTGGLTEWHTTIWNLADESKLTMQDVLYQRTFHLERAIVKELIQGAVGGAEASWRGHSFMHGFRAGVLREAFDDAYEAYIPWSPEPFGPGGDSERKSQNGGFVFRDLNNFGRWRDPASLTGDMEGEWFSRFMDGRVFAMDATSKIHDVWATIWHDTLCESDACFATMLPAAATSIGSLSRFLP